MCRLFFSLFGEDVFDDFKTSFALIVIAAKCWNQFTDAEDGWFGIGCFGDGKFGSEFFGIFKDAGKIFTVC